VGSWNIDENSCSKSNRRSTEAAASEGVGDVMPAIVHCTRRPLRTKAMVQLVKSQRIGPKDSGH
jgi:hypothetical protein